MMDRIDTVVVWAAFVIAVLAFCHATTAHIRLDKIRRWAESTTRVIEVLWKREKE